MQNLTGVRAQAVLRAVGSAYKYDESSLTCSPPALLCGLKLGAPYWWAQIIVKHLIAYRLSHMLFSSLRTGRPLHSMLANSSVTCWYKACVWAYSGGGGLVIKSCPTLRTPWTVAHQAPLSMGFPNQEYWSGLPFPFPDLPDSRIELDSCIAGSLLHCSQIFTN